MHCQYVSYSLYIIPSSTMLSDCAYVLKHLLEHWEAVRGAISEEY